MTLEDSTTYQLILNRGIKQREKDYKEAYEAGRTEEARLFVLILGEQKFGAASPVIEAAVNGMTNLGRLERIVCRILAATDWGDFLAMP